MENLDQVLANETAEATELATLQTQLTALENEKAGLSETDPRFAEILTQQANVKAALDAAVAATAPPAAPTPVAGS